MIIYDLSCDNDHRFEGWFGSAADFDSQMARGLVECPQCGSQQIRRVPSAVAIGHGMTEPTSVAETPRSAVSAASLPPASAVVRQMINVIMAASDDVGHEFAAEARRIHYEEVPARPIRGQTTLEEYEALQDEGIQVMHLPVIKNEDLN